MPSLCAFISYSYPREPSLILMVYGSFPSPSCMESSHTTEWSACISFWKGWLAFPSCGWLWSSAFWAWQQLNNKVGASLIWHIRCANLPGADMQRKGLWVSERPASQTKIQKRSHENEMRWWNWALYLSQCQARYSPEGTAGTPDPDFSV